MRALTQACKSRERSILHKLISHLARCSHGGVAAGALRAGTKVARAKSRDDIQHRIQNKT